MIGTDNRPFVKKKCEICGNIRLHTLEVAGEKSRFNACQPCREAFDLEPSDIFHTKELAIQSGSWQDVQKELANMKACNADSKPFFDGLKAAQEKKKEEFARLLQSVFATAAKNNIDPNVYNGWRKIEPVRKTKGDMGLG